jgi:hypothetical protein
MGDSSRAALIATAEAASGDIGTACSLLKKLAPDSPSPGELISWVCKMRPEVMIDHADRLAALAPQLEKIDSTHVRRLFTGADRGWDGAAGLAFEDRWVNDLLKYVGEDGSSGRRADFAETERMLRSVAQVTDKLQARVSNHISEHIDGLYQRFVEACKTDGEQEYKTDTEIVVTSTVAGAVLAVGTATPPGWAVGALAIVVTAMFSFMKNSVTDARDSVGAAVAGSAMSIQGITEELTDFRVIDEEPYKAEESLPYQQYPG